jgi:NAD(P)-dependent dehydrogenase (short-subunit alcohol dehydrogenase family)
MQGRVVLVTGAGSGIGAATAHRLARAGATVVATDRTEATVAATVEALEGTGHRALVLDVCTETDWQRVFQTSAEAGLAIDGLVNNAGIFALHLIADLEVESLRRMLEVNVVGLALGQKYAARSMQKGGSIVNVSSVAGLVGSALYSSYGATKGAVRAITKSAASELGPQGIRVNSVHPGVVETPMAAAGLDQLGVSPDRLKKAYPLRRFGQPSEVANAIVFLLSDDASFITGAELTVDGGLTAQ